MNYRIFTFVGSNRQSNIYISVLLEADNSNYFFLEGPSDITGLINLDTSKYNKPYYKITISSATKQQINNAIKLSYANIGNWDEPQLRKALLYTNNRIIIKSP